MKGLSDPMMDNITRDEFEGLLKQKLQVEFNVTPDVASDNQIYKALCSVVVDYQIGRAHV